jgi:hypothetical protein
MVSAVARRSLRIAILRLHYFVRPTERVRYLECRIRSGFVCVLRMSKQFAALVTCRVAADHWPERAALARSAH